MIGEWEWGMGMGIGDWWLMVRGILGREEDMGGWSMCRELRVCAHCGGDRDEEPRGTGLIGKWQWEMGMGIGDWWLVFGGSVGREKGDMKGKLVMCRELCICAHCERDRDEEPRGTGLIGNGGWMPSV